MSEDLLIELQTKITYQEDLLEELNKLVAAQQLQIDDLSNICKALEERIKEVLQSLPENFDTSEKPPHY